MAKATTSKTESLTIRVPIELMARIRGAATERGTSVGATANALLTAGLVSPKTPEQRPKAPPQAPSTTEKPVTALKLPVYTAFPPRQTFLRGADKPNKGKANTT